MAKLKQLVASLKAEEAVPQLPWADQNTVHHEQAVVYRAIQGKPEGTGCWIFCMRQQ